MSYCRKCGAKLDEDAKFCTVCGTPVTPTLVTPEPERKVERRPVRPITTLAIVLIALLVTAAIVVAVAFLPVKPVNFETSRTVPHQPGVHVVNLNFVADIAHVNVQFEHLIGNLVVLNVTMTGGVGAFSSTNQTDLLDLTFDYTVADDVLTVTSEVDVSRHRWPWSLWLNTACDIVIDSSLRPNVAVKTSVGGIVMNTVAGMSFNSIDLESTTGGVQVALVKDVAVGGDISAKTTTGGIKFSWDNSTALKNNVSVNLKTTTGGIDVSIKEFVHLLRNVTLKAETTTGGVNLVIDIHDDVGAEIDSATSLGGISVTRKVGFSGTNSLLKSDNYPTSSNFDITLRATTGGIDIDAKYTP